MTKNEFIDILKYQREKYLSENKILADELDFIIDMAKSIHENINTNYYFPDHHWFCTSIREYPKKYNSLVRVITKNNQVLDCIYDDKTETFTVFNYLEIQDNQYHYEDIEYCYDYDDNKYWQYLPQPPKE